MRPVCVQNFAGTLNVRINGDGDVHVHIKFYANYVIVIEAVCRHMCLQLYITETLQKDVYVCVACVPIPLCVCLSVCLCVAFHCITFHTFYLRLYDLWIRSTAITQ